MKDTDEGANEVVRLCVGAQIAAANGALHQGEKCAVDEAARAFDEAHGATRDGVHGGEDKRFVGHVIDQEKHPGAESFERGLRGGEAARSCGELFDFGAVDGLDQVVAGGKVTVERSGADAGLAGDVVEGGFCGRGCAARRREACGRPKLAGAAFAAYLSFSERLCNRRRSPLI